METIMNIVNKRASKINELINTRDNTLEEYEVYKKKNKFKTISIILFCLFSMLAVMFLKLANVFFVEFLSIDLVMSMVVPFMIYLIYEAVKDFVKYKKMECFEIKINKDIELIK